MNENIKPNNERISLEAFQAGVADFVTREISGEKKSGHFLSRDQEQGARQANINFDASQLTEEDRDIWEKIEDKSITSEELHAYANAVSDLEKSDPARASRVIFSEFASNMAMEVIFDRGGLEQ